MMLEGVISILEGVNPRMLEIKLGGFLEEANLTGRSAPHENARAHAAASATTAGWYPTRISSPCCSHSSWCFTPLREPTRRNRYRSCRLSTPLSNPWEFLEFQSGGKCAGCGAAGARRDERGIAHAVAGEVGSQPFDNDLSQTLAKQIATHAVSLQMGREKLNCSFPPPRPGSQSTTSGSCWALR